MIDMKKAFAALQLHGAIEAGEVRLPPGVDSRSYIAAQLELSRDDVKMILFGAGPQTLRSKVR